MSNQLFRNVFSLARHNRKEELESYLDTHENIFSIDTIDEFGNTLLNVACQNGLKRIVKVVLRRESNINFQNSAGNINVCASVHLGIQSNCV